jgi:hypothetical protein
MHAGDAFVLGGTGAVSSSMADQVRSRLSATYGTRTVTRLAGVDRYQTSQKVASYMVANGLSNPIAVVASGRSFSPALVAAPWASYWSAPIVLTNPGGLPSYAQTALFDINPNAVYIVGPKTNSSGFVGDASVSTVTENQISNLLFGGAALPRIGATTTDAPGLSLDMAAFMAAEPNAPLGYDEAAFAVSDNFPDALAAGSMQAQRGAPILLTRGSSLDTRVRARLQAQSFTAGTPVFRQISFMGGTGVIPPSTRDAIASAAGMSAP